MNRLMQRVRAQYGRIGESARSATLRADSSWSRRSAGEVATAGLDTAFEPEEPELLQLRPRTPAKHIDLSAFRELANMSARNAIHQHSRRMLVNAMYSKLTVAGVALVASIGLFWMWGQFGACKMTLWSSLVAIVVAVFWGLEYALLTGRLIVKKSGHLNIERKTPPITASAPHRLARGRRRRAFDRRQRRQPAGKAVAAATVRRPTSSDSGIS